MGTFRLRTFHHYAILPLSNSAKTNHPDPTAENKVEQQQKDEGLSWCKEDSEKEREGDKRWSERGISWKKISEIGTGQWHQNS